MDSVALSSHGASRDGFRRAELALRKPAPARAGPGPGISLSGHEITQADPGSSPAPDPPRPWILPGPGSSPALDPPRPRILPGPGTSLGPGLASRVRAGPELGACSGPWVRRRPHHRARAGPRPGAGTLVRVGLACGGRVRPGPRAPAGESPGQIPAGVRTPPRPSSAPPHRSCRGSGPAGAGGGATWTRDDPRGCGPGRCGSSPGRP